MKETIGIVGGGQLGRMLTLAALPLGFDVVSLDKSANSPAAQVGARPIVGDLYDETSLRKLADESDYITIEIEHLDAELLERLEKSGKKINPSPSTIITIQDKFKQKQFLKKKSIPVAPFIEIKTEKHAKEALKEFGGKMFIKAKHGAYDGRGNMYVESYKDIERAFIEFKGRELYAEKLVPFKKELAVVVARSTSGEIALYPVVETFHERSICLEVLAPADISPKEMKSARSIVLEVANSLEGAGTFGVEMFLNNDGEILVNEIAPRVHNSGHYTIEACHTSQFEQHIRAITGLPFGDVGMLVPAAVMINILGERNGPLQLSGIEDLLKTPLVSLHLYGKSPTKVDRKMGHITVVGNHLDDLRKKAKSARKKISL